MSFISGSGSGKGNIELTNHFRNIVSDIKLFNGPVLDQGTNDFAKNAAQAAPKRTGEMARKIYATKKDEDTYSVVADKFYTKFQEYGTFRIMAKHFLGDAEKSTTPKIIQNLNRNVAKGIKLNLKGGI